MPQNKPVFEVMSGVLVFAESENWIADESAQIISKEGHVELSEWR